MKKILFLLLVFLLPIGPLSFAKDRTDNLISLITLSRETATREKITAMLGAPGKIEETKKKIWWHYQRDNTTLVICWNKKTALFENFSFTSKPAEKSTFDSRISAKLHSGSTSIQQAITLLGTPIDMKIKEATQEMHYAYQNSVLRLFFRDRVLVDYTLLGATGK